MDDDIGIAEMASRAVRTQSQIEVLPPLSSYAEALAVLPTAKPDLVILDHRLGEQWGLDLLVPLGWQLPATKWLLYSGYLSPRLLLDALVVGINGAVSKRADEATLIAGVEQLLAGRSFFCPVASQALRRTPVVEGLTPTERHLLEQIAAGKEAKASAAALGLSYKTVLNTMISLRRKTGAESMVDLAEFARLQGLAPGR